MKRVQCVMAVLLMISAVAAGAQEATLEQGPWAATVGDADLLDLSWQGETILRRGGVRGYAPAWSGMRFPNGAWERTVGEDTVTWTRDEADNQDATVTLTLGEGAARYELDTTVYAQGPTEFSVQIAPEAVFGADQSLVWINDSMQSLAADAAFEKISGIREMRFETLERTITLRTSGFELQDRRDSGSGLFLVSVIGHSNDEPAEVERWIELEVDPATPDEIETRRLLVEQIPTETEGVPLENPGFEAEDPFDGWNASPLATADEDVAHSGQRSARLTVEGPVERTSDVYITRSVPVIPGHRYQAEAWVRGEDVTALVQGGMSAAGVTVIVEFARPDGSWFAGGDYAESQWQTFDWRRVRTEPVKAPEGAGFAIIYLALRGTGTAWFDDVSMLEVTHHPVLLEPLPGASVHDNTPALTWHFPQDAPATVELSRNPEFPADETRTLREVQSPAVVEEPIEPGTWHWRVAVDEYDATSATWSFEQTAGLDEDTTQPTIERSHDWLATPTAPMRVRYADNSQIAKVWMVVDDEDVSEAIVAGAEEATYTPDEPWADGLHVAEVRVEDAAGNSAEETVFLTSGRPDDRITWELYGGVSVNGEKHFLLGMYGVNEADMPEMARAGFDYVHSYRWDGAGNTESALAYLDEAQRNGLQAFMGLDRTRLQAHDERFVAERVAALMRHPGLLAWYLYDEPDLEHQYVSPEWLERYYHLIKALDPFHPVVVTCARDSAVPEYRDALDVHWTQVYGDTARVANRLDLHRSMLREGTPLSAILHSYDRTQSGLAESGGTPEPAQFQPDGRLMRANAFMAIAHNSSGLTWWWWGYGGSNRYFTVAMAPQAWASLQETVARIHELEPVLTGEGEIATRVLEPAEGVEVHVWEKRLPDRAVTIAINRDDQAVEATWAPQWSPGAEDAVEVLWEGREVALQGGQITDSFEPRAVHVYTAANGG